MTAIIIPLFYSPFSIKVKILCGSSDVKFFVNSLPLNQKFKSYDGSFFLFIYLALLLYHNQAENVNTLYIALRDLLRGLYIFRV